MIATYSPYEITKKTFWIAYTCNCIFPIMSFYELYLNFLDYCCVKSNIRAIEEPKQELTFNPSILVQ